MPFKWCFNGGTICGWRNIDERYRAHTFALTLVCSCKWIGNPAEQHFAKRRKWRGGGEGWSNSMAIVLLRARTHTYTNRRQFNAGMLAIFPHHISTSPLPPYHLKQTHWNQHAPRQGTGVRALCRYRSSKSAAHVSNGCVPIIIPPPCVCCVPSIGRRRPDALCAPLMCGN